MADRLCRKCACKLRVSNKTDLCSPCFERLNDAERDEYTFTRGRGPGKKPGKKPKKKIPGPGYV